MSVELAFSLASAIILVGAAAGFMSKKLGIPDVPLLILLGVVVGPLLGLVQAGSLVALAPVFSALAVAIILFEGGMHINIQRVASQSGRALTLAVIGFLLCVFAGGLGASYVLGWPLSMGILLGCIMGGTCSVTTVVLLKRAGTTDKVRTLLSLESAITDVLVIVAAMSLIQVFSEGVEANVFQIVEGIFASFVIGASTGVLSGIVWIYFLQKLWDETYNDITTISVLLGVYAVTGALGGNGAMSALVFGLVVGNGPEVFRLMNLNSGFQTDKIMRRFHEQISFMLRTFFFVYLGLIFNLNNLYVFVPGAVIAAVLLLTRYFAVQLTCFRNSVLRFDWVVMTVIFPRGLATAVLAQTVAQRNLPVSAELADIALSVIMITVIVSSVTTGLIGNSHVVKSKLPKLRPKIASRKVDASKHKADEERYESWFRNRVLQFLRGEFKTDLRRGLSSIDDKFSVGGFKPLLCIRSKQGSVVFDAAVGLEKIRSLIGRINAFQQSGFKGEIRVIVDTPTAYHYLPRLILLQDYCVKLRDKLGFDVYLYTLDLRKRVFMTMEEMRESAIAKHEDKVSEALSSVVTLVSERYNMVKSHYRKTEALEEPI